MGMARSPDWLHYWKLPLVILVVIYHFWCGRLRKKLLVDPMLWTSKKLRLFNELPTLLLVPIVLIVVMKEPSPWLVGGCVAMLALLIVVTIQLLSRSRGRS